MLKYYEIFKFNLKTKLNFKANYIFKLFSFTIHILIFNSLWDFVLQGKTVMGYTKSDLIWFIIIGEVIYYTISNNYIKVSDMVKSGDVANMLTKPINFVLYIFAEEATSLVNFLINLIFGIILGILITGTLYISFLNIFIFVISLILGVTMYILIQVLIGLLAFLTEENESFYLLISKAVLFLVLTPLELFPELMQKILKFLPTTYVSYPVAKIFVHFEISLSIHLILSQIISLVVILFVIYLLGKKGVKNINVNGG